MSVDVSKCPLNFPVTVVPVKGDGPFNGTISVNQTSVILKSSDGDKTLIPFSVLLKCMGSKDTEKTAAQNRYKIRIEFSGVGGEKSTWDIRFNNETGYNELAADAHTSSPAALAKVAYRDLLKSAIPSATPAVKKEPVSAPTAPAKTLKTDTTVKAEPGTQVQRPAVPVAARPMAVRPVAAPVLTPEIITSRKALLEMKENKDLKDLYDELVGGRDATVSEEDFWAAHKAEFIAHTNKFTIDDGALPVTAVASYMNLRSGALEALQESAVKRAEHRAILVASPAIHAAYLANVPHRMSETAFWEKFENSSFGRTGEGVSKDQLRQHRDSLARGTYTDSGDIFLEAKLALGVQEMSKKDDHHRKKLLLDSASAGDAAAAQDGADIRRLVAPMVSAEEDESLGWHHVPDIEVTDTRARATADEYNKARDRNHLLGALNRLGRLSVTDMSAARAAGVTDVQATNASLQDELRSLLSGVTQMVDSESLTQAKDLSERIQQQHKTLSVKGASADKAIIGQEAPREETEAGRIALSTTAEGRGVKLSRVRKAVVEYNDNTEKKRKVSINAPWLSTSAQSREHQYFTADPRVLPCNAVAAQALAQIMTRAHRGKKKAKASGNAASGALNPDVAHVTKVSLELCRYYWTAVSANSSVKKARVYERVRKCVEEIAKLRLLLSQNRADTALQELALAENATKAICEHFNGGR